MIELQGVARHMGSHNVTCHPTQVNTPQPLKAGTRFAYTGGTEG